jgi:hypothetical protein
MSADGPAVPRPRIDAPSRGRLLARRDLARAFAQLEAAARPSVEVEGAKQGTGNSLALASPGQDRDGQVALDLKAKQMLAKIPGRGRLVTKAAFARALQAVVSGLGFALDVDGVEAISEVTDGSVSLRARRRGLNIYIFIQIEIFDNVSGNVLRNVALGSRYIRATEVFTHTSEWEFTQMLELPAATPPRTRTVDVTYWARGRPASATGDPDFDDDNLVWPGDVELTVKKYNRGSGSIDEETTVLIDDPDGVTLSYATTSARSGDELRPTEIDPP